MQLTQMSKRQSWRGLCIVMSPFNRAYDEASLRCETIADANFIAHITG
jgi:hypothetical protein